MRSYVSGKTDRRPADVGRGRGWGRIGLYGFVFAMMLFGSAKGVSSDSPDQSLSLELFEIIAAEHEKALKQLESIRFEYTRKIHEFRNVNDRALGVNTIVRGVEQSQVGQLFCEVKFTHDFPDGNPKGFEESWARRLVVNKQHLASWNIGSHLANSWELPPPKAAAHMVERQLLTLRCPLLVKAYGDDNMTFSEFKNYLKRFPDWRVEVEERTEEGESLYVVTQFSNPAHTTPYKQLLLSAEQGFIVREILHFTAGGAVYQKTRIAPKEIEPGLWFPMHYETVGYTTEGEGGESDPVKADYRSACDVDTVTISPDPMGQGFGLDALGVADGQAFKLHRKSGESESLLYFQGELLPPDVYREFSELLSKP